MSSAPATSGRGSTDSTRPQWTSSTQGTPIGLAEVRELTHSDRVVVKPAVGATARLTIDSGRLDRESIEQHVAALVEGEDVVVQPYVDSITTVGEVSIVAIDGDLTHAVNKRPAAGDWRVQSNFGGTSQLVEITGELRHIADAALGTIRTTPMYARIDVVYHLDRWSVLELELVEPELFFRLAPQAAARLAGRLVGL
jgi:glutathione synthase/RimK-type ligase-like ATP-grasp enzyme